MIHFKNLVSGGTNQNSRDSAIQKELIGSARRVVRQAKKAKVEVKNAVATSDDFIPKPFKSWREYWEGKTGLTAYRCCHCRRIFGEEEVRIKDMVGGHVVKTDYPFGRKYIIPLCRACNVPENTEPFEVEEDLLVTVPYVYLQ